MQQYEQRHDPLRILLWRIITVLLGVGVVLMGGAVWGVYQKERETKEKRQVAEAERDTTRAHEDALRAEVHRLETPRGIEEELRTQFELSKEGEGLIVLVEQEGVPARAVPQQPWWKRFWGQ